MKHKNLIIVLIVAIIVVGGYAIYKRSQSNTSDFYYMSDQDNTQSNSSATNDTDATDVLGLTATNPYSSKLNKYTKVPDELSEADRTNKQATIKTDKGDIVIELFGDEAP